MSCGHARRGRVRARCRMDTNARRRLAAMALGQDGLLTALDVAELAGGGVNLRREVRAGRWRLVLPGVVVAAGTPVDRELLTRAAVLWLPPYGALSHASAARCWGIHVPDDAGVWVTVPWEAPQRSRLGVTVVRTRHLPARWRTGRELRWTPADRTIVDLAQVLSARELDAALLSAVRRGVSSAVEIDRAAMGLHGRGWATAAEAYDVAMGCRTRVAARRPAGCRRPVGVLRRGEAPGDGPGCGRPASCPPRHRRPRTASRLRGRRAAVPLHRCTACHGPAPRSGPARPRMDRRALSRRTPRRPVCRARGPRGDPRAAPSRRGLTPASACQQDAGTAHSRLARRSPARVGQDRWAR
jgi:hypothetical protein